MIIPAWLPTMNKRVKLLLFTTFVLTAFVAVGCGGSGSSGSGSTVNPGGLPFAGAYAGSFTNSIGQIGEVAFSIASNGATNGLEINTTANTYARISGTVNRLGGASWSSTAGQTNGTLLFNSSGQLAGTISGAGGQAITLTVTSTFDGNEFAGPYLGTFVGNQNQYGPMALIVDSYGNVTGVLDNALALSSQSVTGIISGTNTVSVTSSTGTTLTGTLTLAGSGKLTGYLTGGGSTINFQLAPD